MNGKIQNSPIRPPKTLKPHHIRHIISGMLVFLMGIAANEALTYVRRHWPRHVRWNASEMQKDYSIPGGLPPTNVQVEMGIAEDGTVVWRARKE
jgi:hypothetical protein